MGKKGQLTLEYLFLIIILLALIAISLGALFKVKEIGERAYRFVLFKSSALDLYNNGEEVCAMGSGNILKTKIKESITISQKNGNIEFSNSELNLSFSKPTLCSYSDSYLSINSEIEIKNENGEILLREV